MPPSVEAARTHCLDCAPSVLVDNEQAWSGGQSDSELQLMPQKPPSALWSTQAASGAPSVRHCASEVHEWQTWPKLGAQTVSVLLPGVEIWLQRKPFG